MTTRALLGLLCTLFLAPSAWAVDGTVVIVRPERPETHRQATETSTELNALLGALHQSLGEVAMSDLELEPEQVALLLQLANAAGLHASRVQTRIMIPLAKGGRVAPLKPAIMQLKATEALLYESVVEAGPALPVEFHMMLARVRELTVRLETIVNSVGRVR